MSAGGSLWVVAAVPLCDGARGAQEGYGANAGRDTLEGGGRSSLHMTLWGLQVRQAAATAPAPVTFTHPDACCGCWWCLLMCPPSLCTAIELILGPAG